MMDGDDDQEDELFAATRQTRAPGASCGLAWAVDFGGPRPEGEFPLRPVCHGARWLPVQTPRAWQIQQMQGNHDSQQHPSPDLIAPEGPTGQPPSVWQRSSRDLDALLPASSCISRPAVKPLLSPPSSSSPLPLASCCHCRIIPVA
jgi:hypothetical protein